jgi:hypothetical protein
VIGTSLIRCESRPITGNGLPVRAANLLHFPAPKLLEFKALPLGWLLDPEKSRDNLTNRILAQLCLAEVREPDPWLRDDMRIAWITILYASQGNPQPHVDATYRVLGLHPDKVWPAILARRRALLGESLFEAECAAFEFKQDQAASQESIQPSASADGVARSHNVAAGSPKKPCASERRLAPRKKTA